MFNAAVKIASSAKTNTHDIYNTAGSVVQERRWRIAINGAGTNNLTTDARVRFRTVGRGEHEGQALYAIEGSMVYDATLGGRTQIIGVNAVATVP
jgi:hypothetical protein